jgi:hypothetical protein
MEPCQILGVTPQATEKEIKRAFRNLAKRCHPDTSGYISAEHFMLIREAYETLMKRLSQSNTRTQTPQPTYKTNPTTPTTSWSVEDEKKWRERHPDDRKASPKTPEERATEEKVARKREKAQAAYARRKQAAVERAAEEKAAVRAHDAARKRDAELRWSIGDRYTDESGRTFVKVCGRGRRFSPAAWRQILDAVKSGRTSRDIEREFCIDYVTVLKARKRLGDLEDRRKRLKMTPEQIARAEKLLRAGEKWFAVGREIGVGHATLMKHVTYRKGGRWPGGVHG